MIRMTDEALQRLATRHRWESPRRTAMRIMAVELQSQREQKVTRDSVLTEVALGLHGLGAARAAETVEGWIKYPRRLDAAVDRAWRQTVRGDS